MDDLRDAIDADDLDAVRQLMTADPALHKAPMGYGESGPLTWAAECRYEPPSEARLEIVRWMVANGSDIHQGGDAPLMRAALNDERIPMAELLVSLGADVNADWKGWYPIVFAACECVKPAMLRWLLEHGADPNCANSKDPEKRTALDYLIGTYVRSADFHTCVEILIAAGGRSRYDLPGVLDTILDRRDDLAAKLDADPALVHRHYPELDCGSTGARRLLLAGGTLLHVAASFGSIACARLLLDRGADANARGGSDETPLFHSSTQYKDFGLDLTRLLLERGADPLARASRVPALYDDPTDFMDCTALEYAERFPGCEFPGSNARTVALLRQQTRPDLV